MIFFNFFCRNRNFISPRACKTRLLKIVFNSAELLNISAYAQGAMKSFPHILSMDKHVKTVNILPLAEHAQKFVWRRLNEIVSSEAQHAQFWKFT